MDRCRSRIHHLYQLAHLTGSVASVGFALPIGGLACWQVSLTIAVRAAVLDIDFEYGFILSDLHRIMEKNSFPKPNELKLRRAM